ncbi:trk system potassium uptake protein TrkA [Desulfitispora alkaliphila]|uniref:potassium channel family protein n=1 Tax=Desulfitispora alkaliphila TaxID=622674 RepID=UPI003D1B6ACF
MSKKVAVIGLGRFGINSVKTLVDLGYEVLAIDNKEARVRKMLDVATHAVQANATDEATLQELGINNFDIVIVSIGKDIKASTMITLLVKESGVDYVVAKATDELHGKILARVGADRVVYPEREMAVRVAHNLESKNVLDLIELSPDHSILEVKVSDRFANKKLKDLDFRDQIGISIVAVKKHGGEIIIGPGGETLLEKEDILVALGTNEGLKYIE